MRPFSLIAFLALAASAALPARSADTYKVTLTIKNHQFEPPETQVPADQKVELHVVNADSAAEEFESTDLHREKVVPGNSGITLFVGPLRPGTYEFFGDFNPKSARGHLIAR